jgi:hypothetical protein
MVVAVNVALFVALWGLAEAGRLAVARAWPSYEVLFLQPQRDVGWTQVPGLRWTWTGWHWYAADFSVPIVTNASGFRDLDRNPVASPGVRRVALLGDSFIEAVQVPFDRTAAQVLERTLNEAAAPPHPRWEALNFGISNFGVGQYLLTWERYAKTYHPDVVVAFVAGFHMRRTTDRFERGAFPSSGQALWVRPSFALDGDRLVREPARDFDEFVNAQARVLARDFGGQHSRRRAAGSLVATATSQAEPLLRRLLRRPLAEPPGEVVDFNAILPLNLRILSELGRQVREAGGRLIIADVSRYFTDPELVASALHDLSARESFGYAPVYRALLDANQRGEKTRWAHDGHFNEAGNRILAEELSREILAAPAR